MKQGRGRIIEKRWETIFGCVNSRAVHPELARSLETDVFMLVLMRFFNCWGHVKDICSDNGTNCVGADKQIQELITAKKHSKLE